ncbi:hypothetical protein MKZ38_000233 [Zalerion maritima]|uniref:Uncharacterized protein n=1 Tax=Zalerion maritima TaxID=339359 RepID=A0AAD5WN48_9PEZI|nr:hypothetical protein MKZ38_000233 [Zalerion maritima]
MSKVTLLAAPTTEPSMDIHRHQSEFGNVVRPTLQFTQRSQKNVTSIALSVLLYLSYVLNSTLFVVLLLARYSLQVAKLGIVNAAFLSRWVWSKMRQTQRAKRAVRKFEMELTSIFFGPVGNGVALLLLWPGWIIVFFFWALWRMAG